MPRRSAFSWLCAHTIALAEVTASANPDPVGWRPNAALSSSIARRDATSPPAWPPIPSATANRLEVARAKSWLEERTRPTSEADPDRRTVMSLTDFEYG